MMGTQGGKAQGSSSFLKAAGAEANHAAAAVGLTVSEPHCDKVPPPPAPAPCPPPHRVSVLEQLDFQTQLPTPRRCFGGLQAKVLC